MKTFKTYLVENEITDHDIQIITEGLQEEWTPALEAKVESALEEFVAEYKNEDGIL